MRRVVFASAVVFWGCVAQITVELSTNVKACEAAQTSIYTGDLDGGLRTTKDGCQRGNADTDNVPIGTIVLVPSGKSGPVKLTIRTYVPGSGWIEAKRVVGYLNHRSLKLPIQMRTECLNKTCEEGQTCILGKCHPQQIGGTDCTDCPDASATDAGDDASLDAGADTGADADAAACAAMADAETVAVCDSVSAAQGKLLLHTTDLYWSANGVIYTTPTQLGRAQRSSRRGRRRSQARARRYPGTACSAGLSASALRWVSTSFASTSLTLERAWPAIRRPRA